MSMEVFLDNRRSSVPPSQVVELVQVDDCPLTMS